MQLIVTTCDKYANKLLRQFCYCFNTFWGTQQVTIYGENKIDHELPDNFEYRAMGNWPADKYSDGLLQILKDAKEKYVLLLLEDYLMNFPVNFKQLYRLEEYMVETRSDILRMDLTADRRESGHAVDLGHWHGYDLIETKNCQYQLSLQAAIWRTDLLTRMLQPGWSPWQVELNGTGTVNANPTVRVLGTRNHPVKYTNVMNVNGGDNMNLRGMPEKELNYMIEQGWFK